MDKNVIIDPPTYEYIGAFKAAYKAKYNKEYNLQEDDKVYFYNIRKSIPFRDFNSFLVSTFRHTDYKCAYDIAFGVGVMNGLKATGKFNLTFWDNENS